MLVVPSTHTATVHDPFHVDTGDYRHGCAGIDTFVLLFLEQLGQRQLHLFFFMLVATMTVSMGWMSFRADVPLDEVVKGSLFPTLRFAPSMKHDQDAQKLA